MGCGKQARNHAENDESIKAAAHVNRRTLLRTMMAVSRRTDLGFKENRPFKVKVNPAVLVRLS